MLCKPLLEIQYEVNHGNWKSFKGENTGFIDGMTEFVKGYNTEFTNEK